MIRFEDVRTLGVGALLLGLLATACSGEGSPAADGGGDAGATDATTPYDGGTTPPPDGGPRPDARARDSGFEDPDTILEGEQSIAGLRTWVQVLGTLTSTLPPVLVLHDGPGLAHEYLSDPLRFLAADRALVFYDMRASGRTSFGSTTETTTLTVDRHVLDVEGVVGWVSAKTGASKVDLLGHGYGAGVGALYAAAHPEQVDRLVLVAPFPATAAQLAAYNAEAESRLTTGERTLINRLQEQPSCFGDINRCTLEIWSMAGPHYMCDENRALFRQLQFEYGDFRVRDFVELDLRNQRYDWRARLASISAPTTVISGPCSPVPAETAADYVAAIPGAAHAVLTSSGHFPFIEARAEFQATVRAALGR